MKEFKSEADLKKVANEIADSITIRSYDERGNSTDATRPTTPEERTIIFRACYAALLGYNWAYMARNSIAAAQAVITSAEFMIGFMLPTCNAFSTAGAMLTRFIEQWEEEKA